VPRGAASALTSGVVATLAIALTAAEVLAITACAILILQEAGYEPREALPVALTASLGLLSFLAQFCFLLGHPNLARLRAVDGRGGRSARETTLER
jgi:hypothetical protein